MTEAKYVDFSTSQVVVGCFELREAENWGWIIQESITTISKTMIDQNQTGMRKLYVLQKETAVHQVVTDSSKIFAIKKRQLLGT